MSASPDTLLARLTRAEFAHDLRGWKDPVAVFFEPSAERANILPQRRRWLAEFPERHRVYTPAAAPLIQATAHLAGTLEPSFVYDLDASPQTLLDALGLHWEADFVLLASDSQGEVRMEAGVVCFPSDWAPEEKLGQPIEAIHDPVPGLNRAIGRQIHRLLERMRSGYAWQRVNWGLNASTELNQHPLRSLPRLEPGTPPGEICLRLEHQALVRLPVTEGILFGIRLLTFDLEQVRARPAVAQALAGQLRTMPEEVLVYKGIRDVALSVADFLLSRGNPFRSSA